MYKLDIVSSAWRPILSLVRDVGAVSYIYEHGCSCTSIGINTSIGVRFFMVLFIAGVPIRCDPIPNIQVDPVV